jgi:hypothetical protein
MLSKKDITEQFEVTRTTLHNWKTTKPNLYQLLLNSDGSSSEIREVNIALEKYSKTIKSDFATAEIEFILELNLENYLEDIEKLHTIYIEQTLKEMKQNSEFVLGIYQKLQNLNIVERYIFISRIKSVKKLKTKEDKISLIKHYFSHFLTL